MNSKTYQDCCDRRSCSLLAFGGLLYSTLREGTEYYKHVDEVMANPAAWQGKRLQLHGYVVDELDPARSPTRSTTASRSRATARSSRARYTGIVPDTFKDGSEVVLKGTLGPRRLRRRAERRDGEVPVEVRSQPGRTPCPAT